MTNPEVDEYIEGSDLWPAEMRALRPILLDAGLDEQIKWNKPCYGHDGANIAIMQEMKGFLALMYFKGALLDDPTGVLRQVGPNSRSAKRLEFTSVEQVQDLAQVVADFVADAIAIEESGQKVEPAPEPDLAEELQVRLDSDPEFRAAFEALTPGRRRAYNLHISAAKRSATRESRVDQIVPRVLAGKGPRD